jgi:hypothetical protein
MQVECRENGRGQERKGGCEGCEGCECGNDQQIRTNRDVIQVVKFVNQWTNDGEIEAKVPELLKTEVILDNGPHVSPDAMDGGIDGQMRVGSGVAAEVRFAVHALAEVGAT